MFPSQENSTLMEIPSSANHSVVTIPQLLYHIKANGTKWYREIKPKESVFHYIKLCFRNVKLKK